MTISGKFTMFLQTATCPGRPGGCPGQVSWKTCAQALAEAN